MAFCHKGHNTILFDSEEGDCPACTAASAAATEAESYNSDLDDLKEERDRYRELLEENGIDPDED